MAATATKTEAQGDAKAGAAEAPAKSGKKKLFLALGLCAVIGVVLAMVALPKKAEHVPTLEGPFVAPLSKEKLQVNLAGENGKRYLVLGLNAEYFAYSESYVAARLGMAAAGGGGHDAPAGADPLYTAMLKDALLRVAGRKTREEVEDPVQMEAFLMEVRAAIDPLLFPVCVGDPDAAHSGGEKSGLTVGESIMESTFRGMLHEHELRVDGVRHTIRIDEGPEVSFKGDERDLCVKSAEGGTVYVNVSKLEQGFSGRVAVGVAGRVRRIYRDQVLVQ